MGGQPRLGVPGELGELIAGKVDEASDITENYVGEGLRSVVSQPLHEEVRVEDDGLAGARRFLTDHNTAHRTPVFLRRVRSGELNGEQKKTGL